MNVFRKCGWVVPVLTVLVADAAQAAQWYAKPRASLRSQMDDNVTLSPDKELDIRGIAEEAAVVGGARSELWDLGLDSKFTNSQFDESQYDSDDQMVALKGAYTGESNKLNFNLGLTRDSTRDSELLNSGRVALKAIRRELFSYGGSWTHDLNEIHSVEASTSWSETRYSQRGYTEYDSDEQSLLWVYRAGERFAFSLGPYWSNVEYLTRIGQQTSTEGVMGRGVYALSESDQLSLVLGRGRSETDTQNALYEIEDGELVLVDGSPIFLGWEPVTIKNNTTRIDGSYSWKRENLEGSLGLSQNTEGSSDGYVIEYQQANARLKYSFTPRFYMRGSLTDRSQSPLNDDRGLKLDRSVRVYELGASYGITQHWWADFSARRTKDDKEYANGVATSNAVSVGISYIPTESSWSW